MIIDVSNMKNLWSTAEQRARQSVKSTTRERNVERAKQYKEQYEQVLQLIE